MEENKKLKSYCVTGGTGFIGSWLIKSLLQMGYKVHAAVRHPEKSSHLLKLAEGSEMLRLFKADLRKEGSFDEAMRGCIGLFHVAAPMEFCPQATENVDSYVEENMIEPAIEGTLNVLKSCLKSNSVKKVVFTSSISTITARDNFGKWRPFVDESCKIPIQHVKNTKPSGWVYVLLKVLTEDAAFQFAKENGIDLVSTITPTIAGPFLTPTVPSSIRVLLSPITGDPELSAILTAVNTRMGSIALAHIEDICRAHIFLMENIKAEGRYICCARSWAMSEVIDHLKKEYPYPAIERQDHDGGHDSVIPSEISSKKLRALGFSFKYEINDIYVLGVGLNGPVYLATHSSANNYSQAVAVKSAQIGSDEYSVLREEGKILNQLKGSPYIVRCFGEDESVEYAKRTYNLLLECATSGTLLDFILFNGKISEQMAALYAYQLLKGIGHIHKKGYIHGDIKLTNILIYPNNKLVKIADFGSAKEETSCKHQIFDICSVGCVVAKILTGKPTWYVGQINKYKRQICGLDKPDEVLIDTDVSNMAKGFVTECLFCDFTGRLLSVDELINHPFIQNAVSTPENEEHLIRLSSTVNDNLFGDNWISERDLFTTTSEEWKTKIRRSINNPTKERHT
ncbi:dihydroflavonol 4-reductase-like [Solanum verrucosum]|uniref:dihydroflavonol 4-reductase-like n=1 Tax=Solanum verrucosum TaxID=315347 RepID=UPI0020D05A5C|nr:dihydroflavonol 4-reductase-like [Solanum verrucosum]